MIERHFLPHRVQEFNLAGNSRADLDHSGRRTRGLGIKGTSHGRRNLKAVADDDSLPVMVPRNDKTAVPISRERVRRLRKHCRSAAPGRPALVSSRHRKSGSHKTRRWRRQSRANPSLFGNFPCWHAHLQGISLDSASPWHFRGGKRMSAQLLTDPIP
jgi:hypothetical protein